MTQYIDKSVLVAELKNRIRDYWSDTENTMGIYPYALEEVIKYVDTLEVKEVDLENEIHLWMGDNTCGGYCSANIRETAEHFFELGLKAQKVE